MKKNILSLIISVMLFVSLIGAAPQAANAAETTEHLHNLCNNVDCENKNHSQIVWTAWDKTDSLPTVGGNYYLENDVTLTGKSWTIPPPTTPMNKTITINLCLNGHTITETGRVYAINIARGIFNLCDCTGNGEITHSDGDKTAGIYLASDAAAFNMYGGKISNFQSGVDVYHGTFNMYGGEISGNKGYDGVGVYNRSNGVFNMYGGKITNNVCSSSRRNGVGVYNEGAFMLGGNVVISNNKKDGQENNVYLKKDKTITISAALTEGSNIGITTEAVPDKESSADITGANDTDYSAYFYSDNTDYEIANNKNNVVQLIIPHKHTLTHYEALDAACTEAGNIEYWKCEGENGCNEMFSDENGTTEISNITIPANGHTVVNDEAIEATCETDGKTAGEHCSVCNTVITPQTVIPTKGHNWSDWVITTLATETSEGVKTKTCNDCGKIETDEIPKLNHTHKLIYHEAVSATCTETGNIEYWKCEGENGCNEMFSDENGTTEISNITIPANGHTVVNDEAIEATCETDGKTAGEHCSVCNMVITPQMAIPANGHTVVNDEAIEATCETDGKTAGEHCSVCNTVITPQTVIPTKGHNWSDWVITTPTTETSEGVKTKTCNDCGTTKTEEVPKLNHTHKLIYHKAVSADCTETGNIEYWKCEGENACNRMFSDENCTTEISNITIPANGHTVVNDEAIEATCETDGKTAGEHCSVCNTVITSQTVIPAKGHNWSDWVITTPATETGEGIKTKTCNNCGKIETDEIPKLNHTHKLIYHEAVSADCTETGNIEYWKCEGENACNGMFSDENGTTEISNIIIPANGHTVVNDEAIEAACETEGKTSGSHCSICNMVITSQTVIPTKGHNWSDWVITTPATETSEGVKTKTCNDCGITETEEVPKLIMSVPASKGGGSSLRSLKITFKACQNGNITKGNTSVIVKRNSKIKETLLPIVTANDGYKFIGWSNDGKTIVDPTTVTLTTSVTFTALYEAETAKPTDEPTQETAPETKQHKAYIIGYENNKFKPNKSITRAETAAILARLTDEFDENTVYTAASSDVITEAWYKNYIGFEENDKVITGYEDGTFKPENYITRAEFASIITRFVKLNTENANIPFTDIKGHWAQEQISACYSADYIKGYEDNTFKPDEFITRAETVVIINRVTGRNDIKNFENPFNDVTENYWAYVDIMEATVTHNIK